MYNIYIHKNKLNKKIYVGVSTNIKNRWSWQRCVAFNENTHHYHEPLYRAIRKYGWDGFDHNVIETYVDKQSALNAEKYWIKFYKSNIKIFGADYGYNQSSGGEDISNRNWEICENLSKRMSGSKNPMFGKIHSIEVRNKISNTKKINPMSQESRDKLSEIFRVKFSEEQIKNICSDVRSQSEIAKSYGVSRTAIKKVLVENGIYISPHEKKLKEISVEQLIKVLKEDLTIKETSNKLNISTITLYRKIKSLLGEDSFSSVKELIKNEKIGFYSGDKIINSNT